MAVYMDPNSPRGSFGGPLFQNVQFDGQTQSAFNVPQISDYDQALYGPRVQRFDGLADQELAQQNAIRQQQGQLGGILFGQMTNPNAPSVAQEQLRRTTQGNVGNAFAMAQSGPRNPAMMRAAMSQAGDINQRAAGDSAMLRAQEVQNAQGMLGNMLGGQAELAQRGAMGFGQQSQDIYRQADAMRLARMQGAMAREGHRADIARTMMGQQNAQSQMMMNAVGGMANAVGGMMTGGMGRFSGGKVHGYDAGGMADSPTNDTVPAMLSPGEIVLPKSVANAPDAPDMARAFVDAIQKKRKPSSAREGYAMARKAA